MIHFSQHDGLISVKEATLKKYVGEIHLGKIVANFFEFKNLDILNFQYRLYNVRGLNKASAKYDFTRKSADDFDDALLSIKKASYRKNLQEPKLNTPKKVILNYITLLLETKKKKYSESRKIPALHILKNLQDFYNIEEEELESSLQDLRMTIQESLEGLTEDDFKFLENIAESFDTEYLTMFQRMQGK